MVFNLTCLLQMCTEWAFLLRGLPFGFSVIMVHPRFVSCISNVVISGLQQKFMQMCCSFRSAIRKSKIILNTNNKYLLRANAEGYSCKTHSIDSNYKAPSGKKVQHLLIWVVACLRTSKHVFVQPCTKLISLQEVLKLENVPSKHTFYNIG